MEGGPGTVETRGKSGVSMGVVYALHSARRKSREFQEK